MPRDVNSFEGHSACVLLFCPSHSSQCFPKMMVGGTALDANIHICGELCKGELH